MPIFLKEEVLLNCPFEEKDDVKILGARWNADKKKWYIPIGVDVEKFSRWIDPKFIKESIEPKEPKKHIKPSNQELDNLIQYWQYALAFSNLDKLTEKGVSRKLTQDQIESGNVNDDMKFLMDVIEAWEEDQGEQNLSSDASEKNDNQNKYISLLILVGHFKTENKKQRKDQIFFSIPCLIDIDSKSSTFTSQLAPSLGDSPRFNRQYLEPQVSAMPWLPIIGSVEKEKTCFDEIEKPTSLSWLTWIEYANALFACVSGESITKFKNPKTNEPMSFKLVYPKSNDSATVYLKALMNYLLIEQRYQEAALFTKLAMGGEPQKALASLELEAKTLKWHTGHMDQNNDENSRMVYPLDFSQRTALAHFLFIKDGQLLAVDGPPGTGKTSLMRDVIASEWVNATIASEKPTCPIIIASAATNQAVTNIISSFDKVANKLGKATIATRWLSDLVSYGWFLPSKSNESDPKWLDYQLLSKEGANWKIRNKGEGLENQKKSQLKIEYTRNFRLVFPDASASSMNKMATFLHQTLIEVAVHKPQQLHELFVKILKILSRDTYKTLKEANKTYENLTQQKTHFEINIQQKISKIVYQQEKHIKSLESIERMIFRLANLEEPVGFFKRWLKFFFKNHQLNNIFTELKILGFILDPEKYNLPELLDLLHKKKLIIEDKLNQLSERFEWRKNLLTKGLERYQKKEKRLLEQIKARDEFESFLSIMQEVKKNYSLTQSLSSFDIFVNNLQNSGENLVILFQSVLDCTLRTYAFHLTARYWEARWLLEETDNFSSASDEDMLKKIRQYCMLAPCMVATMHSLAKLFSKNINHSEFILNGADLLIIDEAGQASPEIGVTNFSLAKKAIIVGDVKQLKPIWSFEEHEDQLLLNKFNLNHKAYELVSAGYCISSGSIMMMAHAATQYAQNDDHGILLQGHYRCVPTIIEFCNELIYSGQLIPFRKHQDKPLFHPMSFVECESAAFQYNHSWCNKEEARKIAQWLYQKKDIIETYYQNNRQEKKLLADLVGIVTPYNAQIYEIKRAIAEVFGESFNASFQRENNSIHEKMVIGTVHSLQGAEKPIILFSAVSTPEQTTPPFMDNDTDMLNVAVSRAQDCFVLFGHPKLFFNSSDFNHLPSKILGNYMKQHGKRLFPRHIVAVESPSKATLFEKYLGCDYQVIATIGHFRDLDIADEALDFSKGVAPVWKIDPEKEKILAQFEYALSDADKLILGTDNDREGEAISWHLKEVLSERLPLDNLIIERIRFDSIDKETLLAAMTHPECTLNLLLVRAALTRHIIDYLLGKKLTLLVRQQARLEGKENNIYSIGRVQAALLYILKAREDEIATFEIKSYWTINSQLKSNESLFNAFLAEEAGLLAPEKHFDSQEDANIFAEKLEILFERATKRYDEEVITFCKAKPMTTAEVLIQANKEYGLTPLQTMNALQCLYDGSYENEIICH